MRKPTSAELQAAAGKSVPDILAPGLGLVFCGINPSLYSGAIGHHFGRPGNRFWPALHASGITDRLLTPDQEQALPAYGCGITNFVNRATATAAELDPESLRQGARRLERNMLQYQPRVLAVLGVEAYRRGFQKPRAQVGEQPERIGRTQVWVLPNPSGLNASYQLKDFTLWFRRAARAAGLRTAR